MTKRVVARHSRWGSVMHLLHHFLAATMLASLMWVLETTGTLQWLDGFLLRLAGTPSEVFRHDDAALAVVRPAIVEIDNAAYATVFGERSPLDRSALALLFDRIPLEARQVLAIDLDLSMSFPERRSGTPRGVDATMAALVARGVQVVLVLPELLGTTDNLPWIRGRCTDGIHFARSELDERMGAVTRIDPENPTLAVIAVELRRIPNTHGLDSTRNVDPASEDSVADVICQSASTARNDEDMQHRIESALKKRRGGHHGEEAPLNPFTTTDRFLTPAVSVVTGSPDAPRLDAEFRSNAIVLVGGSYDARDVLRTASGVLPGLHVHAASVTSLQSSPADARPGVVFFLDVAIAVGFGYLFANLWSAYGRKEATYRSKSGWCSRIWGFYVLNAQLAILWAVPIMLAAIAFLGARELLQIGWWLNPGPIIIGMFLHSMSLRRDSIAYRHDVVAEGQAATHGGGALHAFKAFVSDHPASLLLHLPLTVIFLTCALRH